MAPGVSFFLAPLAIITFGFAISNAIRYPGFISSWLALAALLFLMDVFLNRVYSLKVQDRVIRLEEQLRLTALLPETQKARIGELTVGQLVALRFASDAEIPALTVKALDEKMAPSDIKKAIRNWRPDNFRV